MVLAGLQSGVLTTEQIGGHGLGRHSVARLTDQRRWCRMGRGLYFAGAGPVPWPAWAWGGVLLGGPSARLGGRAAGHLYGLNEPPQLIDVLVSNRAAPRPREPWRFTRDRALVRAGRSAGNPPRLSVEDTVLDLSEQASEAQIVDLVTKAVQHRLTEPQVLVRAVRRRSRLRHRRLLLELLADVADGAETPLEVGYARDVERAHGLPRAKRQQRARRGRDYRDVTYAEFGLVVELDGRLGHEGAGVFRDSRRDNAAVVSGEVTLRYGWHAVRVWPCSVAFQVAEVLIQRGWPGVPTRCARCRHATDLEIV